MKFPYNDTFHPPFPAVRVALRNSDEGLRTNAIDAPLDTGSDGTLVPIDQLRQILAQALKDTRIRSHWGEWRLVQLFEVDLEIDGLQLPSVFVVGDEQGDKIILGRNVVNRLRVLLDGTKQATDIL